MPRNFGIQRHHPGLARAFDLSVWAYFLDFLLAPIAAGMLLWSATIGGLGFVGIAGVAAAGFAVWTLSEYWIHRIIFHHDESPFEPMHQMHHELPKDMIGIASWGTFLGFGAIWLIVELAMGRSAASAFVGGFILGYLAYCTIHIRMHHGNRANFSRYVAFMFRHHAGHHRGGKGNFGVTSPIWDLAFGSFRPSN